MVTIIRHDVTDTSYTAAGCGGEQCYQIGTAPTSLLDDRCQRNLTTAGAFEGPIVAVLDGVGCQVLPLGGLVPTPLQSHAQNPSISSCTTRRAHDGTDLRSLSGVRSRSGMTSALVSLNYGGVHVCRTGCMHINGFSPVCVR